MKLGYIGVGKTGGPTAGRRIAAGHELVVFDAREAALKPFVPKVRTFVDLSITGPRVAAEVKCIEEWAGVEVRGK